MKIVTLLIVMAVMLSMVGFASAASLELEASANANSYGKVEANASAKSNGSDKNASDESKGIGAELSLEIRARQDLFKEGNYSISLGKFLNVKALSAEFRELRDGNASVKTKLNLSLETDGENKIHLWANLSNGKRAEVKIMPSTASETALARLRLKVCSEENNCTIELKEVGANENAKAEYKLKADQDVKVLGMFKAKMHSEVEVDAETGATLNARRPWWAFASVNA